MALTGSWVARNKVSPQAPLQPAIDPEHLTPTDNPEYVNTPPAWASTVVSPGLPDELYPVESSMAASGWGAIDQTPDDPSYGVGVGPGLTTLESQDRMASWHEDDRGAVEAHHWQHMTNRDGTGPHVVMIDDTPGQGDSPATLQLHRTGVGQPNDPGARTGRRAKRWWDRYYDRRMWESESGPVRPQFARPNPASVQQNPTQVTPPYGNSVAFDVRPPDRFVGPMVRRVPEPWDATLASDGTAETMAGAVNGYGLTVWGL